MKFIIVLVVFMLIGFVGAEKLNNPYSYNLLKDTIIDKSVVSNISNVWNTTDQGLLYAVSDINTADLTDDNTYVKVSGDTMTGSLDILGTLIIDSLGLYNDLILSTTGQINFDNENLITTGKGTFGNLDVDTLNFDGNVISDSTGDISFLNNNFTNINEMEVNVLKTSTGGTKGVVVELDNVLNADFRVGNNNAFVVEGDLDRVGIGTSSPVEMLEVWGNLYLNGANSWLYMNSNKNAGLKFTDLYQQLNFMIGGYSRMSVTGSIISLNPFGTAQDFQVKGDTDSQLLYVDGGNDAVTIGGNLNNGKFNVVGDTYLNGNLEVVDNLTVGDRASFGGQGMPNVSGSVNLTTLYYDTLSANSPHFFEADSEAGYTRFCVKDVRGYYNMVWWYAGVIQVDSNNLRCNQKITKVQFKRNQYPLWAKERSLCEDNSHSFVSFKEYVSGDSSCRVDLIKAKRSCEVNSWSYFENGVCKENNVRKCQFNETTYWDFDNSVCVVDLEKSCLSSVNMSWNDGKCVLDERKVLQNQKDECLMDNSKYWNERNNVCIDLRVIGGG